MGQIICLFSLQVFRSRSELKKLHGASSISTLDLDDDKILDFEPEPDTLIRQDLWGVLGKGKYILLKERMK